MKNTIPVKWSDLDKTYMLGEIKLKNKVLDSPSACHFIQD